jgi:hypothetical protein
MWSTTFTVTHGQFQDNTNIFVDLEDSDYGIEDVNLRAAYLAKTSNKRPHK